MKRDQNPESDLVEKIQYSKRLWLCNSNYFWDFGSGFLAPSDFVTILPPPQHEISIYAHIGNLSPSKDLEHRWTENTPFQFRRSIDARHAKSVLWSNKFEKHRSAFRPVVAANNAVLEPDTGLLLSTYVDDLTLSGPSEQHKPFWDELTALVNVEPPEPIYDVWNGYWIQGFQIVQCRQQLLGFCSCAAFGWKRGNGRNRRDCNGGVTGSRQRCSWAPSLMPWCWQRPFCQKALVHLALSRQGFFLPKSSCKRLFFVVHVMFMYIKTLNIK